jgi:beta-glucosidase
MMISRRQHLAYAASAFCLALSAAPAGDAESAPPLPTAPAPVLADWPAIASPIPRDPAMERKIAKIVAGMTLRQKIGQMTQAEIKAVEPEDIRKYYLGSVLNGGGSWPYMERHASQASWVAMADRFYDAAMSTDMKVKVPLLWGTDAVHGHSNVYGATLFPHNIGLGAARDPELIREIGRATGRAVRATGVNWAFAPTVAVVQDERWGRSYEGFSADPALVRAYGRAYVEGLQGDFKSPSNVVATAKHYMGDGGTADGVNEGENRSSRADMINVHAQGYYGALSAGVQTVMASYSSWNDVAAGVDYGPMHGSKTMLTDVLKTKMGFDGFVISDWDGVTRVPGCTRSHCPQAINAGVDMVMVPIDWREFIDNTVKDVESGVIPMSRIDDAVTRILRVKMRAGLFGNRPSSDPYTHTPSALQARALARRAVRESLVLLKNDRDVLPLKPGAKILVVGKNADSLADQAGGWTISWQGADNTNADFRHADSILTAIRTADAGGSVVYSATGKDVDPGAFDVIIAVVGETPYAETAGDIRLPAPLAHSVRHPEDLAVLQAVAGHGRPVVTVFESGRALYANDLLNASDAFVAAWLPGSEGKGVTDVLFRRADGKVGYDFHGVLPFKWPAVACPRPGTAALFPVGYGLTYAKPQPSIGKLSVEIPSKCADETASR